MNWDILSGWHWKILIIAVECFLKDLNNQSDWVNNRVPQYPAHSHRSRYHILPFLLRTALAREHDMSDQNARGAFTLTYDQSVWQTSPLILCHQYISSRPFFCSLQSTLRHDVNSNDTAAQQRETPTNVNWVKASVQCWLLIVHKKGSLFFTVHDEKSSDQTMCYKQWTKMSHLSII